MNKIVITADFPRAMFLMIVLIVVFMPPINARAVPTRKDCVEVVESQRHTKFIYFGPLSEVVIQVN